MKHTTYHPYEIIRDLKTCKRDHIEARGGTSMTSPLKKGKYITLSAITTLDTQRHVYTKNSTICFFYTYYTLYTKAQYHNCRVMLLQTHVYVCHYIICCVWVRVKLSFLEYFAIVRMVSMCILYNLAFAFLPTIENLAYSRHLIVRNSWRRRIFLESNSRRDTDGAIWICTCTYLSAQMHNHISTLSTSLLSTTWRDRNHIING